jgi:hypothetical protein
MADLRGVATGAAALALSQTHAQLLEMLRVARAANVQLTLPAITAAVAATQSTVQLNQHGDSTNFITLTDVNPGVPSAAGILTVEIKDSAGALSVTWVAGVLTINLSTTDANNTLTLIKAAIDVAAGGALTSKITGTASTQMVHGGTNTIAAAAPGSQADFTHGIGAATAGTAAVAASRTLAVATQ